MAWKQTKGKCILPNGTLKKEPQINKSKEIGKNDT